MTQQEKSDRSLSGLRKIGVGTMIPMVMVGGLLVGYFFGNWIDQSFQSGPWGKIVLSVLGVAAGFKQTIRLIRELMEENNRTQ